MSLYTRYLSPPHAPLKASGLWAGLKPTARTREKGEGIDGHLIRLQDARWRWKNQEDFLEAAPPHTLRLTGDYRLLDGASK